MLKFHGLLIASLLMFTACSTAPKKAATAADPSKPVSSESAAGADSTGNLPPVKENEVSSEDVEKNVEKPYKSSYGEVALDYNEHVEVWIKYFQGRGRKYMEQYLARSTRYLPMMKNVLRENGLPEDLVYISLIESGFSPVAHSHSNAVGYWQFIRGTGRRFGLKVDPFIDERRDPVLSTRAAAEYFKSLYNLFGSWHLALSAYNVGENRVKRAVTRYYTKDFWTIITKRRSLPPETKQYVPKYIAATLIAKDPTKYGFKEIQYEDPLSYDTVALQSSISITKLASNLSVDPEELKLLNPKFRSDYVPIASGAETVVRIPVGKGADALAALSLSVTSQPKVLHAEYYYYRIHNGDNLSTIAHKHHTTVSSLRRLNELSNRTLLRVGQKLKVPDQGGEGVHYATEEDAATGAVVQASASSNSTDEVHVVRRGENLSSIAHRYGITIEQLKQLNNLSSRAIIRKGQKLRVRPESTPKSAAQKKHANAFAMFKSNSASRAKAAQRTIAASKGSHQVAAMSRKHVVRRGETLYDVSKRYNVGLNRLAKANGLKVNYRVMAGEKLVIPE
jgi:membrane-bound lytic murein transglycosylase D